MRRSIVILFVITFFMTGCSKDKTPDTSGTATINNILEWDNQKQTWFALGFLFSEAKLVSVLDVPPPDITVISDGSDLLLQANNLKNSFYKSGEYADAASAKTAFDNLASANVPQWEGLAYPIKANQVWIYRSGTEHYVKIRIISIIVEVRDNKDYGECTFEWVYQPDGSLTFPGK